jgi:hypothetical protein
VEDCDEMVLEQVDREKTYWAGWKDVPWEWDEENK